MATFSAETLAAPFTYTGVCSEVTEFWDRATREANPGKNPPRKDRCQWDAAAQPRFHAH